MPTILEEKNQSKGLIMENVVTVDTQTVVQSDPDILSGERCFKGTRVPVRVLFEHLSSGETLESFLMGYETVTPEQVQAVLELAKNSVTAKI